MQSPCESLEDSDEYEEPFVLQIIQDHEYCKPKDDRGPPSALDRYSHPPATSQVLIRTSARFRCCANGSFTCNLCRHNFATVPELLHHHLLTHQSDWYYWCNVCNNHILPEQLDSHIQSHAVNNVIVSDTWNDLRGKIYEKTKKLYETEDFVAEADDLFGETVTPSSPLPTVESIKIGEPFTLKPEPLTTSTEYCCSYCPDTFSLLYRLKDHIIADHSAHYEMANKTKQENNDTECEQNQSEMQIDDSSDDDIDYNFLTSATIDHSADKDSEQCQQTAREQVENDDWEHEFPPKCTAAPEEEIYDDIWENFPSDSLTQYVYLCEDCGRQYKTRKSYRYHLTRCLPHKCPRCCYGYSTSRRLRVHYAREHGETLHRCMTCKTHVLHSDWDAHCKIHPIVAEMKEYTCDFCQRISKRRDVLKRHIMRHLRPADDTPKEKYLCSYCGASFAILLHIKDHVAYHTGELPFKCDMCDWKFPRTGLLTAHRKRSHVEFKCPECSVMIRGNISLKRHRKFVHRIGGEFPCSACGFRAENEATLAAHAAKFAGNCMPQCKICYKKIPRVSLVRHEQTHVAEKMFKCTFCAKTFGRKDVLKDHINRHTGQKPHQCNQCSMAFTTGMMLYAHKRFLHQDADGAKAAKMVSKFSKFVVTECGYRCKRCDFTSEMRSNVNKHYKDCHKDTTTWQCEYCEYTTGRELNLKCHTKFLHKKDSDPISFQFSFSKTAQGLECGSCYFVTEKLETMYEHIRHDHGDEEENVWKCNDCDYETHRKANLTNHVNKHHKNVRFKCTLCPKSYTSRSRRDEHMNVHTGAKSYACGGCGKEFANRRYVDQHALKHCPVLSANLVETDSTGKVRNIDACLTFT